MDFDAYQGLARRTAVQHQHRNDTLDNAILGLCGEVGELANLWKKHLFHGHTFNAEHVEEELGDILWYIAQACDALDTDLDDIATANIAKLKKRYPQGFSPEASIQRG